MKKYNILVTGCGGDIGQSIGKILKTSTLFNLVIGCDIHDEHAGIFIFDKTLIVSRCDSPSYIEDISDIINQFKIDLILPMSEPELRLLTEKKIDGDFLDKKMIAANLRSREIGFDKLETAYFLKNNHLPFPETSVISDMKPTRFPLIIKSRNGSGSKSLYKVDGWDEFAFYKKKVPDFIAQEFISDKNGEFTCGLFRSKNKEIRSIILKRKLVGGFSGYGEVVEDENITSVLHSIATHLDLNGSINVQLRHSEKGPCVFEINPRFSSTVMFRHMLGFNDLIWSVEDLLDISLSDYPRPVNGQKFYKGFNEFVV